MSTTLSGALHNGDALQAYFVAIAAILEAHPEGASPSQVIAGLLGPEPATWAADREESEEHIDHALQRFLQRGLVTMEMVRLPPTGNLGLRKLPEPRFRISPRGARAAKKPSWFRQLTFTIAELGLLGGHWGKRYRVPLTLVTALLAMTKTVTNINATWAAVVAGVAALAAVVASWGE